MNITKSIHLYAAVLLLLAGQAILGAQQRIQARSYNHCVEHITKEGWGLSGKFTDPVFANAFAVNMCNGNR